MRVVVEYECVEDSHDWGKVGAKTWLIFDKQYEDEYYLSHAPSNWRISCVRNVEDD